jgi:Protein of unknown function (DUF3800)
MVISRECRRKSTDCAIYSYSPIQHIAHSLSFSHWRKSLMSVVTAYFDESNSESAIAVVGIIAEAAQLDRLNAEWGDLLDREKISSFHMKDYAHSRGEFESWKKDEKRRREFLRRIIAIISRRARTVVGVLIDRAAYAKAREHSPLFAEVYDTEYTAAGFLSLLKCSNWADKQEVAGPIAFIFDDGNPQKKAFQRAFNICKRSPEAGPCHFGSLTFADDRHVRPLQVADFVAYEV